MEFIDFKLEKRFPQTQSVKDIKLLFTENELTIKIPISAIPHNSDNPDDKFRTVKKSTEIKAKNSNVFIEPTVKLLAPDSESTSNTRLTIVVEFDSKKPKEENID